MFNRDGVRVTGSSALICGFKVIIFFLSYDDLDRLERLDILEQ